VKKPKLLLCDEPTDALDYETSKGILELIEQVSHDYGCTTIIVTHNAANGQMATRRLRLREGALVENELNPSPIPAAELEWQGAGMRNPLHRRFERQLVHEAGKHLGIFVLLIVTIGVVSEFLATSASMQKTYADLDGTDALEDARFETAEATTDEARSAVEDLGVKVYDNPSRDAEVTQDGLEATVRVYVSQNHADIDTPSLFEGHLPEADDEIALDDACCANHGLEVATPSSSRARRSPSAAGWCFRTTQRRYARTPTW
jgi:energy-coupling factor transporter ATP-binding protein EcfA2